MLLAPQLLLLGLMALGSSTLHAAPSAEVKLERGSCPMFWFGFNGRCYKYVPSLLTWGAAEKNCVSQGANLASVHSREEHEFVLAIIQNFSDDGRPTWIGLSDNLRLKDWWSWTDGSEVTYTKWSGDNQPPQNLVNGGGCGSTHAEWQWTALMCVNNICPSVCVLRMVCP